jgi:hypothetical protein
LITSEPNGRLYAMPSSKNYKRDYSDKGEGKYDKSPKRKAANNARKRARYKLEKEGKVKKGDGKDVIHKNGNPTDNRRSNLGVQKSSKNRSYKRTKTARKKNPRD